MPEAPLTHDVYQSGAYDEYLRLLRESLGDTPLLQLRDALKAGDFMDENHPTRSGAKRMSERVVSWLREIGFGSNEQGG